VSTAQKNSKRQKWAVKTSIGGHIKTFAKKQEHDLRSSDKALVWEKDCRVNVKNASWWKESLKGSSKGTVWVWWFVTQNCEQSSYQAISKICWFVIVAKTTQRAKFKELGYAFALKENAVVHFEAFEVKSFEGLWWL